MSALRTWDAGKRCAECCNGDRCDDPTHFDRSRCPHCKSTGWAIWTEAGREDYVKYLQGWRSMSEADARAALTKLTGATPSPQASEGGAVQLAINALEAAKNGLEWYRDARPMLRDGSDDEMDEQIEQAIAALRASSPAGPRQPLTDEQIDLIAETTLKVEMDTDIGSTEPHAWVEGEFAFARAIEAAHGIVTKESST